MENKEMGIAYVELLATSDGVLKFPYGFKHGTVLAIGDEEYERIKNRWPNKG